MRTYNNIQIVVFGLMAVAFFAAGFFNGIHFLFAMMASSMAAIAFADNRFSRKGKSVNRSFL